MGSQKSWTWLSDQTAAAMFIFCLLQKRSHNITHYSGSFFFPPTIMYYCSVYTHVVEFGNWGVEGECSGVWPSQSSCLSMKQKKKTKIKELDLCTSVPVSLRGREEVTSPRKQLQLGKSNEQSVVEEGQSLAMNTLIHSNWKMGTLTH